MSKSDRGVVDVMVCGLRSSPVTAVSFLFIKKVKCAGANLIQLLPIDPASSDRESFSEAYDPFTVCRALKLSFGVTKTGADRPKPVTIAGPKHLLFKWWFQSLTLAAPAAEGGIKAGPESANFCSRYSSDQAA